MPDYKNAMVGFLSLGRGLGVVRPSRRSGILCIYLESLFCKRHSSFRESPEAGYKVSKRL